MANDDLADLPSVQAAELKMLAALDHVAQAAGCRYFVAYGTALGAVRERRQIPWDTDTDVLVPLPDYGRLISQLRVSLPPGMRIADEVSQPGYGPLFARIALEGRDHWIVHVDLFPLAGAPSTKRLHKPLIKFNHLCSRVHLLKSIRISDQLHYSRAKGGMARVIRTVTWPIPRSLVRRAFWWLNTRWAYDEATSLFNPCGPYGAKEFFPSNWFRESREGEISGVRCRLPVGVEEMLSALYGDYLTPISEQHQREAYEFFDAYVLPRLTATP